MLFDLYEQKKRLGQPLKFLAHVASGYNSLYCVGLILNQDKLMPHDIIDSLE